MKRTQENKEQVSNKENSIEPSLESSKIGQKEENSLLSKEVKKLENLLEKKNRIEQKIRERQNRNSSSLRPDSFIYIGHPSNRDSSRA